MHPIAHLDTVAAAQIRGVFTDIDDTLTDDGKLGPEAYASLWRLRQAGLWVVPVTGRPAGWCDMIARQWPVDAVIGENGALVYHEVGGILQRFYHPDVADVATAQSRLETVKQAILAAVPGCRLAKDQAFRLFDLAIDFAEEEPRLGLGAAQAIADVFAAHGAQAKVSSIHVNGWFGDYDKLAMTKMVCARLFDVDLDRDPSCVLFCGDSPNDEPMFEFFPNACGVANLQDFADRLDALPRYVSEGRGGAGFAEVVEILLARRGGGGRDA